MEREGAVFRWSKESSRCLRQTELTAAAPSSLLFSSLLQQTDRQRGPDFRSSLSSRISLSLSLLSSSFSPSRQPILLSAHSWNRSPTTRDQTTKRSSAESYYSHLHTTSRATSTTHTHRQTDSCERKSHPVASSVFTRQKIRRTPKHTTRISFGFKIGAHFGFVYRVTTNSAVILIIDNISHHTLHHHPYHQKR